MLAQYGVARDGLPGEWPTGYDDATTPYTPAWQAERTSVPAEQCIRIAREFARNAEESGGRSMIIMGAGICQWFHGDATYRAILSLLILTGSMGRNGGGWAHYVGQEKCRPITGWISLANALDWSRPPRTMTGTSFWYMHTGQWRNDGYSADSLGSPLAKGHLSGMHTADTIAQSAAAGLDAVLPAVRPATRSTSPTRRPRRSRPARPPTPASYVADALNDGDLQAGDRGRRRAGVVAAHAGAVALEPVRLLGQGQRVLPQEPARHPLQRRIGERRTPRPRAPPTSPGTTTPPEGKLDLLVSADFRMTSTTLLSDVVLPAATWYEKHDLSSTDMHPFVHAFSPAIDPPWEARTDFEAFHAIARRLSELAEDHLGTRKDLVSVPLQHDTPGETRSPAASSGLEARRRRAVPGQTRRCSRWSSATTPRSPTSSPASGRSPTRLGFTVKNVTYRLEEQVAGAGRSNGVMLGGAGAGRPAIDTDKKMAEAILRFSGTTNGALAVQGFRTLEERVGKKLHDLAEGSEEKRISFADTQAAPVPVITSPEWSGSETGGRRYAPFTVNIERLKPFHTLTGRMHFYLDHDWMTDVGEALPTYRPPLDMQRLFGEPALGPDGRCRSPCAT